MSTITISLPDQIARKVDAEAQNKGFATRSEFVRSLLRKYFAGEDELQFKPFEAIPLTEIREEFTKTGKYNKAFIDSVVNGLRESSLYES